MEIGGAQNGKHDFDYFGTVGRVSHAVGAEAAAGSARPEGPGAACVYLRRHAFAAALHGGIP